jgi:uncharacterized protein
LARIEVPAGELARCLEEEVRSAVVRFFKGVGFTYVTLDLQGYRTGAMNEVLDLKTGEGEAVPSPRG